MTRLYFHQPNLNAAVIRYARARMKAAPACHLAMASYGSWSSPKTLQDISREPLPELMDLIRSVAGSDVQAWLNCNTFGSSVGVHDHDDGRNRLSGVYYLTTGAPIHFPRTGLTVEPQPGLMLIFPPAEPHEVLPQREHCERYSVAWNAR